MKSSTLAHMKKQGGVENNMFFQNAKLQTKQQKFMECTRKMKSCITKDKIVYQLALRKLDARDSSITSTKLKDVVMMTTWFFVPTIVRDLILRVS